MSPTCKPPALHRHIHHHNIRKPMAGHLSFAIKVMRGRMPECLNLLPGHPTIVIPPISHASALNRV